MLQSILKFAIVRIIAKGSYKFYFIGYSYVLQSEHELYSTSRLPTDKACIILSETKETRKDRIVIQEILVYIRRVAFYAWTDDNPSYIFF